MISRSTLLHLRIPFSLYLMPVFCFAMATGAQPELWCFLIVFISIHLFLYPSSNGYNSYFDKDEKSIGGLEDPPPVNKELYYVSLIFDAIALLLGFLISWQFSMMLFVYGLVSKAYSHPYIRLKKNGLISWLAAGIFQGGFTYLMVKVGLGNESISNLIQQPENLLAAALSTSMIFGFYPMTQVYQHEEDSRRGDMTISYKLGILNTFHFSAFWFALAAVGFWFYFKYFERGIPYYSVPPQSEFECGKVYPLSFFLIFLFFLLPLLIYFTKWYLRVRKKPEEANFRNTMLLNKIASYSLICFFIGMAIYKWWVELLWFKMIDFTSEGIRYFCAHI